MKSIRMHPPLLRWVTLCTIFALLWSAPLCIFGVNRMESEFSVSETSLLKKIIFFGDSTTYHLIAREALPEGKATKQVWCPKNGTLLLSPQISSLLISHPNHKGELPLTEALTLYKPEYFVITAGLNGAHTFTEKRFKHVYTALIEAVQASSPETKILLQSVFPVGANESAWKALSPRELNEKIDLVNAWIRDLAEERSILFLDTQRILRDNNGFLKEEYQVGDGIHLSKDAYRAMLAYILASLKAVEGNHAS